MQGQDGIQSLQGKGLHGVPELQRAIGAAEAVRHQGLLGQKGRFGVHKKEKVHTAGMTEDGWLWGWKGWRICRGNSRLCPRGSVDHNWCTL